MPQDESSHWIVPTKGAKTLPAVEILTGRGFITGKSGSGKSNSASVIAEELLDRNYNLLIVDPEGEYFGLKEQYEILHVGNDEFCDVQVGPNHAEKIAEIALHQNMPVILDVSDYLDADEAQDLIGNVIRHLFEEEKEAQKPFLLMVEEMQEYLPQTGGSTELSELLERVAKRGRKRGLGILGISQRPAAVNKEFITQCDWLVWHRLNWKNDLDVVRNILGSKKADEVEDFDTGEAYLMTDWDDSVERVKFKRKKTHDAGATPGLESYDRPDLKSVSREFVQEIKGAEAGAGSYDLAQSSEVQGAETDETTSNPDSQRSDPLTLDTLEAAVESPEPDTNGDEPQVDVPEAQTQEEPLDVSEADLDSLEAEELRDIAQQLLQRNRILQDEVTELRSVLKQVEQPASGPPREQSDPKGQKPEGRRLAPPEPPRRPPERSGVGGNLLELMEMTTFLMKTCKFRVARLMYRMTSRDTYSQDRTNVE